MKKHMVAFLLISTLLFGGLTEGIAAKELSAGSGIAAEAAEEIKETEEIEDTEKSKETEETKDSEKTKETEEIKDTEEIKGTEEAENSEDKEGTEEMEKPEEPEITKHMPTGLQKPIQIDLKPEDITEVYDESETQNLMKGSKQYRSLWDTYSSNYYYNFLSKPERDLWDRLDNMCYGYLAGTESLTTRDSYVTDYKRTVYYYRTKSVAYDSGKLSASDAYNVILLFYYSNPQYYFMELYMRAGYGYAQMSVNASFANGVTRQNTTRTIETTIKSWLEEINQEETDWAKEKKIHDMICEKVIYDPYYSTISSNPYNQTIYSVFCTNSTVCAGYSQAMQLLCNAVGIDCAVVTSEEHEWNIVRLNDAWYYVDCTWNDKDGNNGYSYIYNYFNRSSQYFMSGDKYNVDNHTPEKIWSGRLPLMTYDSGAALNDPGIINVPKDTAVAPVISCPGSVVTITAPAGGTVYYTINGDDPSCASTKSIRYTNPFPLYGNTTVKAMVAVNGYWDSVIISSTITPLYRITFQAYGGYIGTRTSLSKSGLFYDTNVGTLPNPTRSGYAFWGWYTDPYGGSKISAASKITADSVYYARWIKVKPQKAVLSSVKNKSKKSAVVKIKNNSIANGFQIRYSVKANMKGSKKKTVSGNTYTIRKLKKGKTYYVQARMYQIDSASGAKKYGAWSKKKSVKVKK